MEFQFPSKSGQQPKSFNTWAPPTDPNATRKYAGKWIGKVLLVFSVLGGSSLGVIANSLPAEGPLLFNAWRFQALLLVSIFIMPFYYLYDRYYLKYQRYRVYLDELQEKQKAKQQQRKNDLEILGGSKIDQMLSRQTYEDKYPRDTEDSRTEPPLTKEQTLKQFEAQDKNGFRTTLNKTLQKFNQSVLQSQQNSNLALFDLAVVFGKRTFVKNLYFITFITAFFYCCWSTIMIWGSRITVQSHVYCLCNLHGVMLVPLMMATGKRVHKLEKIGFIIICVACIAIIFDQWSYRLDHAIKIPGKKYEHHISNIGTDFIMLVSNVPAFLYFALNRSLMKDRILPHVLAMNLTVTIVFCVGTILIEDSKMNLDREHGLLGWLSADLVFTSIFSLGFFATFFGSVGYLLSMQFYSPMTCMHAYLMEPFFAQILGYMYGIDKAPGTVTIIGVTAVAFSSVLINKGTYAMIESNSRKLPGLDEKEVPSGAQTAAGQSKQFASGSGSEDPEMSHLEMLQNKVKKMQMNKETLEQQIEKKQLLGLMNKNSEEMSSPSKQMQKTKVSDDKGAAASSKQGGQTFSRILDGSLYN